MSDRLVHAEHVMGTVVSLAIRGVAPEDRNAWQAVREAVAFLHEVDATLSTYREGSALRRLQRGELLPADAPDLLRETVGLAERVGELTGGWFSLRYAGRVDPTGVVKGWAAEQVSRLLLDAGLPDHCVNAAGDIRVRGGAWRVGLTDPHRPGRLLGVVTVTDLAVATSGTAERGPHILDPTTGRPATGLAQATVLGPDAGIADGVATALVAAGDRAALSRFFELGVWQALTVSETGELWSTPGFPLQLTPPSAPP